MRLKIFKTIIPIIIVISIFLISYRVDVLFIGKDSDFSVKAVADIEHGGSTTANFKRLENDSYLFSYILGDKIDYPYADFTINKKNYGLIDFSDHDKISIKIKSTLSDLLVFRAYSFIDGISIKDDYMTYLPLEIEVPVSREADDFTFSVKDLEIPLWWYIEHNIKSSEKFKYSLESIVHFQLSNHDSMELHREDLVEISYIIMSCSIFKVITRILVVLFIYFVRNIYVFIYVCVYIYIYIYTCTYIHVCMYIYMCVCTYIHE